MEKATLENILPQEGTSESGESLPEPSSGCPSYSGGGKGLLYDENKAQEKHSNTNRKFIQQAFHPSLFITRPRSSSLGSMPKSSSDAKLDDQPTLPAPPKTDSPPTWQRIPTQHNAKRKKPSSSPPQTKKLDDTSHKLINTSNRYSGLPVDQSDEPAEKQANTKKISKPPPIILYGIEDLSKLTELIEKSVPKEIYAYKIINRDQLRIMTQTTEAYKDLIDLIRKNGLIGHTFTQKDKRCCRLVIKNLHYTTPKTAITDEIEKSGNIVKGEVINPLSRRNKKPLNMFFVNIEPGPNNIEAKKIQYIYHTRVKIEDPRKTNEVPQCTRCQQYGHTKINCMRQYRCVKCAEGHKTIDCPKKDRNTPATCVLCLGNHPANYKGCQVYKEIRARKITQPTHKKIITTSKQQTKNDIDTRKTDEFPQLKPSTYARNYSTKLPGTETTNAGCWNKKSENMQSQPTSLLEKTLIKQSEKIDILIQQIGTLMGLLTTLVAQCKK